MAERLRELLEHVEGCGTCQEAMRGLAFEPPYKDTLCTTGGDLAWWAAAEKGNIAWRLIDAVFGSTSNEDPLRRIIHPDELAGMQLRAIQARAKR